MRRAPATVVYVAVLAVTSCVLATSSAATARRLLLERSTNLHELGLHPLRVLVASAFWLPSAWQLLLWAPLFLLLVAPVERRFGSLRTVGLFALGHVGATLLTALGLWLGIRIDLVEHAIAYVQDVGPSYGFFAVVAAAAPPLLRVVPPTIVVVMLAAQPTFTNVGHLLAVCLGLAAVTSGLWPSWTGSGTSGAWAARFRRSWASASGFAAPAARPSSRADRGSPSTSAGASCATGRPSPSSSTCSSLTGTASTAAPRRSAAPTENST